jgi:hypothetical protein
MMNMPASSMTLAKMGMSGRVVKTRAVGRGIVAWLAMTPSANGVMVLDEPRARGRVKIEETGRVSALRIVNDGDAPILVPADVILGGGLQTRTIDTPVIVDAGRAVMAPARCVEKNRWHSRDDESASRFRFEGTASFAMKQKLAAQRRARYERTGEMASDQGDVWREVEDECTRTHSATPTSSYEGYLRRVRAVHLDSARRSGVRPPSSANGAIVITGKGASIDVRPSSDAIAVAGEQIIADLFDGAVEPPIKVTSSAEARRVAEDALAMLLHARLDRVDAPEHSAGDHLVARFGDLAARCIVVDGAIAYVTGMVHG